MGEVYGSPEKGRIALFHCTDDDIRLLAKSTDAASAVARLARNDLRWKVLQYRLT